MKGRASIGRALGRIPSGLFVLSAGRGERVTAMLVSFVQQVGFEPPAVCVAVRKGRDLEQVIRDERQFCLAVLDEGCQRLVNHFAGGFAPGEPAFDGIELAESSLGIPYPAQAHAHLCCRLLGEAADWSDHTVFCGEAVGGDARTDREPLVHVRRNGLSY